jgi:hypothetical protein
LRVPSARRTIRTASNDVVFVGAEAKIQSFHRRLGNLPFRLGQCEASDGATGRVDVTAAAEASSQKADIDSPSGTEAHLDVPIRLNPEHGGYFHPLD